MAVSGEIEWTVNPAASPALMESRPTACVIQLKNLTTGAYDDSTNATIDTIYYPNPPDVTTGTENYSGKVTIPANTTATSYKVEATPMANGQQIQLAGGGFLQVTQTITVN